MIASPFCKDPKQEGDEQNAPVDAETPGTGSVWIYVKYQEEDPAHECKHKGTDEAAGENTPLEACEFLLHFWGCRVLLNGGIVRHLEEPPQPVVEGEPNPQQGAEPVRATSIVTDEQCRDCEKQGAPEGWI